MRRLLLLSICWLALVPALGQDGMAFQEQFRLNVDRSSERVRIDGVPDEPVWKSAAPATRFREKWPNDKDMAKRQTEVRAAFDDTYLYFFIVARDTNRYVAQTLKRDAGLYESDAVSIAIDPVNERTNGFLFSITPYNVQSEDLVSANMGDEPNFSWDNKWLSATKRHDTYWTAEIAIPFKTLRYRADRKVWGINFLRSDVKNMQYSSWTHMPMNFDFYDFGYSGALVWQQPPPPPGTNISFIPYVTGAMDSDAAAGRPAEGRFNAGFDGKVSVTPSLNLDVTVNPDFSQVEVDRQVTNLTRFDIFFPERRTFFLENDDLFSGYGIPPIRPFYSRRIGLDPDGNRIPIIGGLRLSGNLDKRTRIGLMNMQTLAKGDYGAQNYTAATFNTRVQSRSLIKGYFLNRQATGQDGKSDDPLDAFGRNLGFQYDFSDKAGRWIGWSGFHKSFKPGIRGNDLYLNGGGGYQSKAFDVIFDYSDLGDDFYADMGFVNRIENYDAKADSIIRRGYRQTYTNVQYRMFPEKGRFMQHNMELENGSFWNRDGSFNENSTDISWESLFRNSAGFTLGYEFTHNALPFHTDFTGGAHEPLPPGYYRYGQGYLRYRSDGRKLLIMEASARYGGFFNGTLLQLSGGLTWRVQPWGNFSLNVENASIRFPEPYGSTDLLLIAPRIEVNFSNNLFWTTFLQLNTQNNNFNINSRLQWRFKPMSDVFLVYTDNYFTDPLLKNRNRAIVFKMNYWLNL